MSFEVFFSPGALDDLGALHPFVARHDPGAASAALVSIEAAVSMLRLFPLSCRRAAEQGDPLLRELVVPFGRAGFVLLFRVQPPGKVFVLAARHQRQDDFP